MLPAILALLAQSGILSGASAAAAAPAAADIASVTNGSAPVLLPGAKAGLAKAAADRQPAPQSQGILQGLLSRFMGGGGGGSGGVPQITPQVSQTQAIPGRPWEPMKRRGMFMR